MMSSPRLVRGTKGRLFAGLGVLTLFAGIIFLYHSTRVELDEVRNGASKCRQEQDSLAAQVQVITEYKVRLEKSLQQEKAEHRQTKEELQTRMNNEQQSRDRENLENVNKYKALQQQYKLLQSEREDLNEHFNKLKAEMSSCTDALIHLLKNVNKYRSLDQEYKLLQTEPEDLNDYINKLKSEKSSCTDALSRLEALISILQHQQVTKDSEVESLRIQNMKLEEDNIKLSNKLASVQLTMNQENKVSNLGKESSLVSPETDQHKRESALIRGSSTKGTNRDEADHEGESAGGNQVGYLEPPQKQQPAGQRSSTATQEKNLLPARPAQPAPVVSAASNSKASGKHPSTPEVNPQALLSHKAAYRGPQAIPLPLMLSPQHSFNNGESIHNGLQDVLPAPLGFGHSNHAQQQVAYPLQPPYRQQRIFNQEVPQNQGQSPPIAPADTGSQNDVLPAPPMPHRDYVHMPNFDHMVLHNMNPFQGETRVNSQGQDVQYGGANLKSKKSSLHNIPGNNVYLVNKHNDILKPHESANIVYDMHDINKIDALKKNGAHDLADLNFLVHNKQFAGHESLLHNNLAPPINKDRLHALHQPIAQAKNVKLVQLDGDVNQHGEVARAAGDDFDLGPHQSHHGDKHLHPQGKLEIPHGLHYNYQGGDYDKEEQEHLPQADDDDDVDPADYNNEMANQGHADKKMVHRRFAVPQHHDQDGVMVNPR